MYIYIYIYTPIYTYIYIYIYIYIHMFQSVRPRAGGAAPPRQWRRRAAGAKRYTRCYC